MGLLDTRDPEGFDEKFMKAKPLDKVLVRVLTPYNRKTSMSRVIAGTKGIFFNNVPGQQGLLANIKCLSLIFSICGPVFWVYGRMAKKHPFRLEHH